MILCKLHEIWIRNCRLNRKPKRNKITEMSYPKHTKESYCSPHAHNIKLHKSSKPSVSHIILYLFSEPMTNLNTTIRIPNKRTNSRSKVIQNQKRKKRRRGQRSMWVNGRGTCGGSEGEEDSALSLRCLGFSVIG